MQYTSNTVLLYSKNRYRLQENSNTVLCKPQNKVKYCILFVQWVRAVGSCSGFLNWVNASDKCSGLVQQVSATGSCSGFCSGLCSKFGQRVFSEGYLSENCAASLCSEFLRVYSGFVQQFSLACSRFVQRVRAAREASSEFVQRVSASLQWVCAAVQFSVVSALTAIY